MLHFTSPKNIVLEDKMWANIYKKYFCVLKPFWMTFSNPFPIKSVCVWGGGARLLEGVFIGINTVCPFGIQVTSQENLPSLNLHICKITTNQFWCTLACESVKNMTELPHDKINEMTVCPAKTQLSLGIRPV